MSTEVDQSFAFKYFYGIYVLGTVTVKKFAEIAI